MLQFTWILYSIVTVIDWNVYETRQTPLLYVLVDLTVHNNYY